VADSFCIFSSAKQSIVTTKSCKAELDCSNLMASYLVWAAQLLEGFGSSGPSTIAELHRNANLTPYAHKVVDVPLLNQDNASAIHLIEKGRGNFKNSKHIRVRYYFILEVVGVFCDFFEKCLQIRGTYTKVLLSPIPISGHSTIFCTLYSESF
jgi:hypothetical protein